MNQTTIGLNLYSLREFTQTPADIAETLKGTVLEDAPLVPTSVRTRQGLDELLVALQGELAETEPPFDRGLRTLQLSVSEVVSPRNRLSRYQKNPRRATAGQFHSR